MTTRPTRRRFIQGTSLAIPGFWIGGRGAFGADSKSPNEKLNIAAVGCGGQGGGHVDTAASERLVAMCDVDARRAADRFEKYSDVPTFEDFRMMFDKMHKDIDAVFVATPDHLHAPIAMAAMRLGKGVYCEKPLAHSVSEARAMAKLAAEQKVATQMGNQGHSSRNTRQVVETIRSGVIGRVSEVHTWCPKNFTAQKRPQESQPIPAGLNWDLWLGPAPQRPYHEAYLPFNWRSWWDFGTGGLGDMACHIMDPIFWAFDLQYPSTVEAQAEQTPQEYPEGFAPHLTVKYEFPDRGDALHQKAVTVYWHHGDHIPSQRPLPGVEFPPKLSGKDFPGECTACIGEKGVLIGSHGRGVMALMPKDQFADFEVPEVENPMGHSQEWIKACKEGTATGSNFDYAAKLTETVLLGNVAWRVGKKLEWDAAAGRAANAPEADALIQREYREGWRL